MRASQEPSRPEPERGLEPPGTLASAPRGARGARAHPGDAPNDGRSPGQGPQYMLQPWPERLLVGMCLLSSLQLLPNSTGESLESGRPGTGSRAPVSSGHQEPVGRAPGGRICWLGLGPVEQGQRPRSRAKQAPSAESPPAEEACPGREPPLGPENVGRGRDREGDLEEGPANDVRSPPGSFS